MKFSTALTSFILASCSLARVQASPADLFARYCFVSPENPEKCVDVHPVPIDDCVRTQRPALVTRFTTNGRCTLYSDVDCTGLSLPIIGGGSDSPPFVTGSFKCFAS